MNATFERGIVVTGRNKGMGGFLNPPGHPEHTMSVETYRGSMSLSAAVESEWLSPATRAAAKSALASWVPLPLTDRASILWVKRVMAYFAGCYVGMNAKGEISWNASDLRIDKDIDPILNANIHAGVHVIRKYYPDFTPTTADLQVNCSACGHHLNAHANGEGGKCTVITDMAAYESGDKTNSLCNCQEFIA